MNCQSSPLAHDIPRVFFLHPSHRRPPFPSAFFTYLERKCFSAATGWEMLWTALWASFPSSQTLASSGGKRRGCRDSANQRGESCISQICFLQNSQRQPDTTRSYRAGIVTQTGVAGRGVVSSQEQLGVWGNRTEDRQPAGGEAGSHFLLSPRPGNLWAGDKPVLSMSPGHR